MRVSNRTKQAHALRALVFSILGEACKKCGSRFKLEIHVISPVPLKHHELGNLGRWKFYLSQAQAGRAQILCQLHHRQISRRQLWERRTKAIVSSSASAIPPVFEACTLSDGK